MDRAILQKWLKSGYMEKHVLHETTDGTPQGGIISPALANCALDGLERLLREKYPAGKRLKSLGGEKPCVNLVRYADDFVVMCATRSLCEQAEKHVRDVLARWGLLADFVDLRDLAALHRLKTGCLFAASVGLALWAAGVPEREMALAR
jgi:RNA-directed DNA polymerase